MSHNEYEHIHPDKTFKNVHPIPLVLEDMFVTK